MSVLKNFEKISGLGCNVEKTVLMQVGDKTPIPHEISVMGLDIKNELTLLGTKIRNNGLCFETNINSTMDKVRK